MRRPIIKPRAGFSATEAILVTCVIVFFIFLISLLIDKTRDAAHISGCMGNLRRLYMGIVIYSDDHDGYWLGSGEEGTRTFSTKIWTGEERCWLGILYHNYVDDIKTYYCPARSKKNSLLKADMERFGAVDKDCYSDYEGRFYPGEVMHLDRLKRRVLVRCGKQEYIPAVHPGETEMMLMGNGSVTKSEKEKL